MGDTNSIVGIVKILEAPKQKKVLNHIFMTEFRVQFSQVRKNKTGLISLVLWGNLAGDVARYYRINDYILIEGYLSVRTLKNQMISFNDKKRKKIQITALKVYPFMLKYDRIKLLTLNR